MRLISTIVVLGMATVVTACTSNSLANDRSVASARGDGRSSDQTRPASDVDLTCRAGGFLDVAAADGEVWIGRETHELEACTKRNASFVTTPVTGQPVSRFLALRDQVETCSRSAGSAPPSEKLKLDYPALGPNRTLRSNNYSLARIQKLIAISMASGVDPNLAIALALLESPPLVQTTAVQGYEYGFGDLPLDAFPLFDKLGCLYRAKNVTHVPPDELRQATSLFARTTSLEAELNAIRGFGQFRDSLRSRRDYFEGEGLVARLLSENCPLSDRDLSRLVCTNPAFRRGLELERDIGQASSEYERFLKSLSEPRGLKEVEIRSRLERRRTAFVVPSTRVPDVILPWASSRASVYLCAAPAALDPGVAAWFDVRSEADPNLCCARVAGLTSSDGVAKEMRNALAVQMIQARIKVRPGVLTSLASDVQAFNGRGRLGNTESVENRCFNGLDMAKRPFYGARVLDLMLNTLLTNPRVQQLIAQASAEFGFSVKSVFCDKLGVGIHGVKASTFLDLQRTYLLGGEGWRNEACRSRFR